MLETNDYQDTNFGNAINTIMGCPVMLRDKSNNLHHGILSAFVTDTSIVLDCCHQVDPSNECLIFDRSIPKKSNVATRVFQIEQIVKIDACQVDGEYATKSLENSFIDSAIVEKSRISDEELEEGKDLVPFEFDLDGEYSDLDSGLHSKETSPLTGNLKTGWNPDEMFTTNMIKFGYKSTYDPNLREYTVPLEKKLTDEYKERELEAEKIACEIEKSRSYRRNIDKELSDNEEEEYAFSAVLRSDKNNNSIKSSNYKFKKVRAKNSKN